MSCICLCVCHGLCQFIFVDEEMSHGHFDQMSQKAQIFKRLYKGMVICTDILLSVQISVSG